MALRLARHLDVPLRERNRWLLAAGYAPLFAERALVGAAADPAISPWRDAVQRLLDAHDPAPAMALDRHWNLVAGNRMAVTLLAGVPADLRGPPLNLLRVSLHPRGLAPHVVDLPGWRAHALHRLRRQIQATGDPGLADLLALLRSESSDGSSAASSPSPGRDDDAAPEPVLSLSLDWPGVGRLDFITTVTVFGTPADITTSELAIETLLPANPETAERLRRIAGA
jgi:hypothetical protein